MNRPPLYEFRCSLCRALANFDMPIFGRLQDSLPAGWIARCLKSNPFDLVAWLRSMHTWLKEYPIIRASATTVPQFSLTEVCVRVSLVV